MIVLFMQNIYDNIVDFIEYNKNGQVDGHRSEIVDYLVAHHTAGREMINTKDIDVMDYFDTTGRKRGYESVRKKSGHDEIKSYHTHPKRKKETFAQAHFALHKYNLDGNKYGWRLVPLIVRPFENVAWHAGNWKINQRSIGIEICGNYVKKKIDENALLLIAETFKFWYKDLKQKGLKLKIKGHKDFANTACPGLIYNQLDIIRENIKK